MLIDGGAVASTADRRNETSSFTSKKVTLNIDDIDRVLPLTHALSTELRLRMIGLLANRGMSVNEIARELDVPVSTTALNVQVLEKAGLITCDMQPGVRGVLKVCDRRIDQLTIRLDGKPAQDQLVSEYDMPVGCYSLVGGIRPTCGLVSYDTTFDMDDCPAAFYHPQHFQADLLWMREGYVEYHFPNADANEGRLDCIEFSFEACAEAPCYRNDWPSDIYVSVNGQKLGVWHCPGDFGGRRGQLNPEWWGDANTQYGQLKTWRVNNRCTTLENESVSGVSLKDLRLSESDHISLRIGVDKLRTGTERDGTYGGMNLFGSRFGDFSQNIVMRCVRYVGGK